MVSELPTRPRVLILDRSVNQANHRAEIVASMARHTDAQVVFVQGDWQSRLRTIPERRLFDAIVWKQKFADLVRQEPIDWAGYRGLRVLFDLDTIQNYSTIAGADMLGKWVSEFRRHKFDLLITTGKELQRRFMADGVTSCWLPKAFDPKRVAPSECPPSRQYCYYGERYAARKRLLARVQRAKIDLDIISPAYADLAPSLGRYLGCVICNMELKGARVVPNSVLARLPLSLNLERVGLEPMIKNFEVAGAGCAPICDAIQDLFELGFVDGVSMATYTSYDGLIDKLRYYRDRPDDLAMIGNRAAALVHGCHTWDHRGRQFRAILEATLS